MVGMEDAILILFFMRCISGRHGLRLAFIVSFWTEQASIQYAHGKFHFVPATDSQSDKTRVQDLRDRAGRCTNYCRKIAGSQWGVGWREEYEVLMRRYGLEQEDRDQAGSAAEWKRQVRVEWET